MTQHSAGGPQGPGVEMGSPVEESGEVLEAVVCMAGPPLHSPFRRTGNFTTHKREENGKGGPEQSIHKLSCHYTNMLCAYLSTPSAAERVNCLQPALHPPGDCCSVPRVPMGVRRGRGVEPTKATTVTTQPDYRLTKDFKQNWKVSHLPAPMHHTICSGSDDARSHLLGPLPQ